MTPIWPRVGPKRVVALHRPSEPIINRHIGLCLHHQLEDYSQNHRWRQEGSTAQRERASDIWRNKRLHPCQLRVTPHPLPFRSFRTERGLHHAPHPRPSNSRTVKGAFLFTPLYGKPSSRLKPSMRASLVLLAVSSSVSRR